MKPKRFLKAKQMNRKFFFKIFYT